jgi:uncharacterized protein (TIGR03790 family)
MVPMLDNVVNGEIELVDEENPWTLKQAFNGFHASTDDEIWNQTPWQNIAIPDGFDLLTVIDYSDVGVLINNNSEASKTIGWAFVNARNISMDRVFIFNDSGTPTGETINREQFETFFMLPFFEMLNNRSLGNTLNYLVTTKGIPLRVNGGNDKASFDQEFSLLGGQYNSSIGANWWVSHEYGPLAGKEMEVFTRQEYGFYLVTRLTGYTVDTALGLIEKANNSLGQRGTYVLDLATNRNNSGYKFWNDDLYTANTTLNGSLGLPVIFDEETEFITNISNVMGYASWGSNDGNWNTNRLPNSGFDTEDLSYQSSAKYWQYDLPSLATGEGFDWNRTTATQRNGDASIKGDITPDCQGIDAEYTPGILGEYFDNAGISFNTSLMPDLTGRSADAERIETTIDWSSRATAWPGLDDRFKFDWSARYTASINIPETGDWTFYVNSDDGSELWIDHVSIVQNYGVHAMREISSNLTLTTGNHDLRLELFEGGGVHGLKLSWQGPNQSKSIIPASAFTLSSSQMPQNDSLIHHWDFEEGSGSIANDSIGGADFTLTGMDASNWVNCAEGNCLRFDGINDLAKVDVTDWSGNFTISQFVMTNTTNQSTYASTFAIGDVAGSNLTFQHMVNSGNWKLHNNQTTDFSEIQLNRWSHLATVFDNGTIRQYFDGNLVATNTMPSGSFNNFDVYKIGANRAGSSFFNGFIDSVSIWDVALTGAEVLSMSHGIFQNCQIYSGVGVETTTVWSNMSIPENHTSHVWILYSYAMLEGRVAGKFNLVAEAYDTSGNLLSVNRSSDKQITNSWSSKTMRFRPHQNATSFRIGLELTPQGATIEGSYYFDTMNLRAIRPHMQWIDGSIAETAVSTGGRSFKWNTGYGQSLVADLLEDGASGLKGYVYEPYLTAVGAPSVLLPSYAMGYNLAESHAAANRLTSWMGVVVGDPKMSAYADIFHDVSIMDARQLTNASLNELTTIQIAIENRGMSEANGTLTIQDVQGNKILSTYNLSMPKGDIAGSRILLNLTYYPENSGWTDIRIIYQNSSSAYPERNTQNNLKQLRIWVNEAPVIDSIICDSTAYSRGDNFICTVAASDDINVTSVGIKWLVIGGGITSENGTWISQSTGRVDQTRWQTSIMIPTTSNLGNLALQAIAEDESGQISVLTEYNISQVLNASATWFGPHVSGVDDSQWVGATSLPNHPTNGIYRGENIALRSCVLDADLFIDSEIPSIMVSRGNVTNLTYVAQNDSNHHCFVGNYSLEIGQPLTDLTFELYSANGLLLNSRQIEVADRVPEIGISVVNSEGFTQNKVLGGGDEFVKIVMTDIDDPLSPIIGDLYITWPGAERLTYPIDILAGSNTMLVELPIVEVSLESGNLLIDVQITGKHGASQNNQYEIPLILTLPEIVDFSICNWLGPIDELMFGKTATLTLVIDSERPIESTTASLYQENWVVSAPEVDQPVWSQPDENCLNSSIEGEVLYFRIKLDSSFTDDGGTLSFNVKTIDGLSSSGQIPLRFIHAPPVIMVMADSEVVAGEDLKVKTFVNDADGLADVTCFYYVLNGNQSLANVQSLFLNYPLDDYEDELLYPVPIGMSNQSLNVSYSCADSNDGFDNVTIEVNILPPLPCNNCSEDVQPDLNQSTSGQQQFSPYLIIAIVIISIIISLLIFLNRNKPEGEQIDWASLNEDQQSEKLVVSIPDSQVDELFENQEDDAILQRLQAAGLDLPEGWTLKEYSQWLDGPLPEGWVDEQWQIYRGEKLAIIESQQLF